MVCGMSQISKVRTNSGKQRITYTAAVSAGIVQCNLDLTKSPGTGQIRSLSRGLTVRYIEVLFHIFYHYRGKKIQFVISRFSFNRGS